MAEKKRVLILCAGNSARSQMAEGILRRLSKEGGDEYRLAIFRRVRDEIRVWMNGLIKSL